MTRLALVLLLLAAPAQAAEDFYRVEGPSVSITQAPVAPGALDRLFERLRAAPDAAAAKRIANGIWKLWLRAPDERAASRMNRNIKYRGYGEYWDSMDQIGHVIRRFPDYPEAWNQRAILHYLQRDHEASIRDCERALKLEPRHFGCMSGIARIHLERGARDEARRWLGRAREVYPLIAIPGLDLPRLDL